MPEYLSPGVYVEEVDRGPKPIEGVGTAMAAFVGFTEKAEYVREVDGELITEDLLNKPQLITNWTQYVERFGEFAEGAYLPHAVYGYFHNGGTRCYVVSVKTLGKAQAPLLGADGKPYLLIRAKQAGYAGLRLRVKVDVPELPKPKATRRKTKSKEGEAEPEAPAAEADELPPFTLIVERQGTSGAWQVRETISDVTLVEVGSNGDKKIEVAYKNNKAPQLVDLLVPETDAPLAKIWPRAQEQSLNLEQKLLAPATSQE
ncbi:MAG TPA: hypothetical protein ENJ31_04215, partial [Anaerolineae bacterium]|nr:hypothetical protein [Anaerolineae bacterium]